MIVGKSVVAPSPNPDTTGHSLAKQEVASRMQNTATVPIVIVIECLIFRVLERDSDSNVYMRCRNKAVCRNAS